MNACTHTHTLNTALTTGLMALLVWLHNRKRYASTSLNNTTIQVQQNKNNNDDTDPAAMQLLCLSKKETDDEEDIANPAVSTLTTPLNDTVNPQPVAAVVGSRRRLSMPFLSAWRTQAPNRRRSLEQEHVQAQPRRARAATRTLSIVSRSSLTDVREEQRVVNT